MTATITEAAGYEAAERAEDAGQAAPLAHILMPRITADDLRAFGQHSSANPSSAPGMGISARMDMMRRRGRLMTSLTLFPEWPHGAMDVGGDQMWAFAYSSGAWQDVLVELISLTRTTRDEEIIINGRTTHSGVAVTKSVLVHRDGVGTAATATAVVAGGCPCTAGEDECCRAAARIIAARLWNTDGARR